MSYNLKTLIVFDTNSLRSTEAGDVAYSFFEFGKPFQVIEEFITQNGLQDDIHIAIPSWVIEELKVQKDRKYKEDIEEYKKITTRLMGLPGFGKIPLPNTDFNCIEYVEEKAEEYLSTKNIKLLDIKEEVASTVLKNMMVRVMKENELKAPFANLGKSYKDAGFKDNIVWESLMNFDEIPNYDKVIFITKDGDFNKHCETEFKTKWQRYIDIEKDEYNVITSIKKEYSNYIEHRKIYEYAQKEYFEDYLKDNITPCTYIDFMGVELKIENYSIDTHCTSVEMLPDDDGDFICPVINSLINVFTKNKKGEKIEIPVMVKTYLSDKEYMEIQGITFSPEIH